MQGRVGWAWRATWRDLGRRTDSPMSTPPCTSRVVSPTPSPPNQTLSKYSLAAVLLLRVPISPISPLIEERPLSVSLSLSLQYNQFHPSFRTPMRGNKSYRRKWQNGLNSSLNLINLQFRRIGGVESQTSQTGTSHTLLTPGNAEILVQKFCLGSFFGSGGLLQWFCWGQYQKNVMHGLSSVKCWLDCLGIINREWLSLIRRAISGCHDVNGSGKTQRFLSKAQQLPAGGNSFLSCCGSDIFSRTIQIKKFLVGWRAHLIKWFLLEDGGRNCKV